MSQPALQNPIKSAPSVITLVIPCKSEFASVARLTILGVAAGIPWSADEVEDLRLAVGEVCADAIDRAEAHEPGSVVGVSIEIIAILSAESLTIDIRDHVPPAPFQINSDEPNADNPFSLHDRQSISDALLCELVDSFERSHEMGGTVVRLIKRLPPGFSG